MAAPDASKGDVVVALWDYQSASKDELSFAKNDKFKVLKTQDDGWWQVQSLAKKKKGFIPANLMAKEDSLDLFDWYHGPISRGGAEYLLQRHKQPGTFLVRESQTQPGSYTITLFDGSRVLHYRINEDGMQYNVRPGTNFPSISGLIQHLQDDPDGISICLSQPAPKAHARAVVISKKLDKQWELKRSDITLGKVLGSGNYGDVYVATYAPLKCEVAVKTVKEDSMEAHEFMQEAHVMKKLQHKNLVRLIGVCSETMPMYIVTEYVPHGDLLNYLYRRRNSNDIDSKAQLYMASQVCEGMAFLESQKVIHRDLAARNCLVADELVIKIADFGMGRVVDDDLYTAHKGAKMPIKWSAPEALCYNAFSNKSDIWSYGILLWEIVTFSETPYPELERNEVLTKLEEGYRMPEPENCPPGLYKIMRSCWEMNSEDRPTFAQVMIRLARLQDPTASPEDEEEEAAPAPAPAEAAAAEAGPAAAAAAATPEPRGSKDMPPPLPARSGDLPPIPAAEDEAPPPPPRPSRDAAEAAVAEAGDADSAEPEEPAERKESKIGRSDWRKSYRNKPVDLEMVNEAIDAVKEVFAKTMAIIRYGDDDTVKEQVPELTRATETMLKLTKKIGKNKAVSAQHKNMEAALAAIGKSKLSKSKLEPHLTKMRDLAREMRKLLNELCTS